MPALLYNITDSILALMLPADMSENKIKSSQI